jgi:chaperone required for assembly of F1-ATPase
MRSWRTIGGSAAAHVDEDWNMAQWGSDEVALQRRAFRFAEFQAAALVLRTLGQPWPGPQFLPIREIN